jgi:5-methyltetrahydrofolate--homocysteine methyltransferase
MIVGMDDAPHPLTAAVIEGNREQAIAETHRCLADGEDARLVIERYLVPGLTVVGEAFKNNDIFVPEMLIAARAMKGALAILEPLLTATDSRPRHLAIIGTVHGDLHDIGKDLVAAMWKGANIAVMDLGVNVSAATFAEMTRVHRPDIVGMSALLTTTMPNMRTAAAAVRSTGVPVRLIVGGAPVFDEFAAEIGADGWAPDASTAVDVALELLGEDPRPRPVA